MQQENREKNMRGTEYSLYSLYSLYGVKEERDVGLIVEARDGKVKRKKKKNKVRLMRGHPNSPIGKGSRTNLENLELVWNIACFGSAVRNRTRRQRDLEGLHLISAEAQPNPALLDHRSSSSGT